MALFSPSHVGPLFRARDKHTMAEGKLDTHSTYPISEVRCFQRLLPSHHRLQAMVVNGAENSTGSSSQTVHPSLKAPIWCCAEARDGIRGWHILTCAGQRSFNSRGSSARPLLQGVTGEPIPLTRKSQSDGLRPRNPISSTFFGLHGILYIAGATRFRTNPLSAGAELQRTSSKMRLCLGEWTCPMPK